MRDLDTIIKQANTRLLGNIYQHLFSDYFYSLLKENHILNSLDENFTADNYDGIVVFSNTNNLINLTKTAAQFTIEQSNIIRAISRISCDKQSNATYDLNSLTQEILDLHQSALTKNITLPINSKDCNYKTQYFSLTRKSPNSFVEKDLIIDIEITENHLKPLASAIINSLSSVLDPYIYIFPDFVTYITHEQWSDYQINPNYIGLKKQLRLPKTAKKIFPNLLEYLNASINEIKNSGFIDKFHRQIQTAGCLISDEELITSSGFLVTKEYWSNITISDIETIFSKIDIRG
ncbi:hypothetical protein HG449_000635 [Candidatus Saccharibacteria bacterium]|nr:hypothetical protein [Candidatus Saccharibacteria bacterium]